MRVSCVRVVAACAAVATMVALTAGYWLGIAIWHETLAVLPGDGEVVARVAEGLAFLAGGAVAGAVARRYEVQSALTGGLAFLIAVALGAPRILHYPQPVTLAVGYGMGAFSPTAQIAWGLAMLASCVGGGVLVRIIRGRRR